MVAPKCNEMMTFAEIDYEIQNGSGIRSAINVIAQHDNGVVGIGGDEVDKRRQRVNTAVNIADCQVT
jgi:hypothetical protein